MALRDHSDISKTTRERVQQAARDLGYRPVPLLARISRRHDVVGPDTKRPLAEVAFISFGRLLKPARERMQNIEERMALLQEPAAELGYKFVVHHLTLDDEAPERLGERLYQCGYIGVMVGPIRRLDFCARFTWHHFTCVGLSGWGSWVIPPVHSVMDDPPRKVERVWHELIQRGYRRPGLLLFWESVDTPERNLLEATWLREQWKHRDQAAALPWSYVTTTQSPELLKAWFKEHRPDVVVGYNHFMLDQIRASGVAVPEQCGFVDLHRNASTRPSPAATGFGSTWSSQVMAALLVMDQELRLFRQGLPEQCRLVQVASTWVDGVTLPSLPASPAVAPAV